MWSNRPFQKELPPAATPFKRIEPATNQEVVGQTPIFSPERILKKAIGKCTYSEVLVQGVAISCLMDSGSQVSTITKSFFRKNYGSHQWQDVPFLRLTAANGLSIPYCGYVELDVTIGEHCLPDMGLLVVRESEDKETRRRKGKHPGVIGSNIIDVLQDSVQSSPVKPSHLQNLLSTLSYYTEVNMAATTATESHF